MRQQRRYRKEERIAIADMRMKDSDQLSREIFAYLTLETTPQPGLELAPWDFERHYTDSTDYKDTH